MCEKHITTQSEIRRVRNNKIVYFKQKTAYEMRISDWSSDVCSSDLRTQQLFRRKASADVFPRVGSGQQRRKYLHLPQTVNGLSPLCYPEMCHDLALA